MVMSAVKVFPLPLVNTGSNARKLSFFEEKATLRTFQAATCSCSCGSKSHNDFRTSPVVDRQRSVAVRATEPSQQPSSVPIKSILCKQCEGNGALVCSQCKGDGINKEDFFNGRFKAGTICWLCRGKREILCGECNGAGFIGGFLSSFEE